MHMLLILDQVFLQDTILSPHWIVILDTNHWRIKTGLTHQSVVHWIGWQDIGSIGKVLLVLTHYTWPVWLDWWEVEILWWSILHTIPQPFELVPSLLLIVIGRYIHQLFLISLIFEHIHKGQIGIVIKIIHFLWLVLLNIFILIDNIRPKSPTNLHCSTPDWHTSAGMAGGEIFSLLSRFLLSGISFGPG